MYRSIALTASLASIVLARTDLTGCTSTDVSSPAGASIAWYVPGTGELCDFLDCGGGRAPPKTTVPGCPLYSGTATYSPSYLPGYGSMASATSAPSASSAWASSSESASASGYSASGSASSSWAATESTGAWTSSESKMTSELIPASSFGSSLITSVVTASTHSVPTTAPAVVGGSNGTAASTGSIGGSGSGSGNGTYGGSSSPSNTISGTSGAMETARVWVGGVAALGLGAVVAAL